MGGLFGGNSPMTFPPPTNPAPPPLPSGWSWVDGATPRGTTNSTGPNGPFYGRGPNPEWGSPGIFGRGLVGGGGSSPMFGTTSTGAVGLGGTSKKPGGGYG